MKIENKIPSIGGLATTSPLTAVENKIPDSFSGLVKKKKKQIITQKLLKLKKKLTDHNKLQNLQLQNLII